MADSDSIPKPNRFNELLEKRRAKLQTIRSASQYFENSNHKLEDHDEAPEPSPDEQKISLLQESGALPVAAEVASTEESKRRKSGENINDEASNSCWRFFSVLYALALIVLGTAFPLAEILSIQVPPLFYQKFYLYLYGTSLLFLFFTYIFLLESGARQRKAAHVWIRNNVRWTKVRRHSVPGNQQEPDPVSNYTAKTGSFFLRMGAILFGIGSMLYSCLEFGQYFELQDTHDECSEVIAVVTPGFRFLFCFVQLYFIFTNSRIRTDRYTSLARFGLMHMLATNICIWLSVLIEETKHELQTAMFESELLQPTGPAMTRPTNNPANFSADDFTGYYFADTVPESWILKPNVSHSRTLSCRARTTVGNVLQQASPFLYPCIVEHSLICAALTFVMWSKLKSPSGDPCKMAAGTSTRTQHQYTVDCHGATRGLFVGLLMSLMTMISMIMFFVWIYVWRDDYFSLSIFQAYVVESILYGTTIFAVGVAFCRIRALKFEYEEGSKLDDILLIISQMGVYVFPTFILISGHHTMTGTGLPSREDIAGLVSTVLEVIQSTVQTVFLLDATRRRPSRSRHVEEKPGREFVMFLLVCNFNLWAIDSMEAWRQQLYPQQLRFYGTWTWTLITHISMPLTIFYRFHSSVCLSEVWKAAYKYKSPSMTDATV